MKKINKVYFAGGINMIDNKLFGICRTLQETMNELVEEHNEMKERIKTIEYAFRVKQCEK